jgi:hypothetical protein
MTQNNVAPAPDVGEIKRALAVLFNPGDVVELRAPKAGRAGTISGYYDDFGKLAADAMQINKLAGSVYVTINTVNPDLLARRANRYVERADTTTADDQVIRRRRLPIDVDPARPAGISSTDAEHNAAIDRARQVYHWLVDDLGWPHPMIGDSGNGAHVLPRIDLPNDDQSRRLVENCLRALDARFSDQAIHVDTTVHNAARIWKLYGTVAGKGDHTAARPHRLAKLLYVPEKVEAVPLEKLQALAAMAPQPEAKLQTDPRWSGNGAFDLDRWIAEHNLSVRGPDPWRGGRKWVLPVCPWNPEHTNGSAFITQGSNGAIGAGCHHNGCQGKGWHDLRDVAEPAWRDQRGARQVAGDKQSEPAMVEQPWPEIVPFDVVDLPEFPADALPGALREWVEAESHATQTPADLAGLLALAVCSATIARRMVVEPRAGWWEPVNLYTAVLLDPGNRKSAVFSDATAPLREIEAELIEAARPAVARQQSERRQAEARLKKLEKQAAEKDDIEARNEAGNLAEELAAQPEPVLPRLIVDDVTSEKLGAMLAEQGGRLASTSPEGGVFDLMAGLYSKSGIPQFGVYLMGHSGDDLITDRVSRKGVRVERPALTCAYAMQSEVIRGLAGKAAFRGRGLLARFLYAAPQSWIGRREIAPAPVSDATREAYRQTVRALADLEGEPVLRLGADASGALREWESEIESMLGDGGQMEIMRDWGAKLAGATLRLAAVLHCVGYAPDAAVGGPTFAAAVEIARYLIPHAEAVLALMQAKEASGEDDARYVLRWIERHGRREFTKTEAQHHGKRRFPKADDIDPALAELTRRGYIRLRPAATIGPGRPPSPSYEVNPAFFTSVKPAMRSHNSHNPAGEVHSGNSGNNGSALGGAEPIDTRQTDIPNDEATEWTG